MTILVGFLLPALVLLALRSRLSEPSARRWLLPATLGAAAVPAAAAVLTILASPLWRDATEIAWVGLSANQQRPLVLGGNPASAQIGWPNRAFAPRVEITGAGPAKAEIAVAGGGGFVKAGDRILSGTVLPADSPLTADGYTLRYRRSWLWHRLEIDLGAGGRTASFKVRRQRREAVYSLQNLLYETIVRLRGESEQGAELAEKLHRWAAQRLLLTRKGQARLLDEGGQASAVLDLPGRFTVRWRTQELRCLVRAAASGRLEVVFEPPWRLTSPLPPPDDGVPGTATLTFCRETRPFEKNFLLPLGGGLLDPRVQAVLDLRGPNGPSFRPGQAVRPFSQPQTLPAAFGRQAGEHTPGSPVGLKAAADIDLGPVSVRVGVARDLPESRVLFLALVVALVLLSWGLWRLLPELRPAEASTLAVVVVAAWSLLMIRLLLSARYALEPGRLDRLAVTGSSMSLIALGALPGAILLVALLHRAQFWAFSTAKDLRTKALHTFCYLIGLYLGVWLLASLGGALWKNAPPEYHLRPGLIGFVFLFASFVYFFGVLVVKFASCPAGDHVPVQFGAGSRTLLVPLELVRRLATRFGPRLWRAVGETVESKVDALVGGVGPALPVGFSAIVLGVLFLELCTLGIVLVSSYLVSSRVINEVLAPLILCWVPAVIWLASRLCFMPGETIRRFSIGRLTTMSALIVVPLFGMPLAMRDAGGLLASIGIFLPLTALLVMARPRRVGLLAVAGLALGVVAAFAVLQNPRPLLKRLPGEMGPRALAVREWSSLQRALIFHGSLRATDPARTPVWSLKYALQHAWESKAIAHEGGILGLGFGNAPTQRSQVRQDTIQADSVFTFFIVSEHGSVGGVALLMLTALPLLAVVLGARQRFDVGHGVAILVTGALLIEATYHAAMNLGVLPITGRNYPLLSVNSPSDLLRWTILLALGAQAVLWRATGVPEVHDYAAVSILSPQDPLLAALDLSQEPRSPYLRAAALFVLPSLALVGLIGYASVRNATDPEMDRPFSWQGVLDAVKDVIGAGQLSLVDPNTGRVALDEQLKTGGRTLLEEEVNRFNALSVDERLRGVSVSARILSESAPSVRSLADFDRLMTEMQTGSAVSSTRSEPPLLVVTDERMPQGVQYALEPNPAYNSTMSFKAARDPASMPRVSFRSDDPTGARAQAGSAVVGPAWAMGRWVTSHDPIAGIPWLAHLEAAAFAEWRRLGPKAADAEYGHLGLSRQLQARAQEFARAKGRGLHAQVIETTRRRPRRGLEDILPPRVALSIMDLPTGELLALGGWPRMDASTVWTTARDGERIPPRAWVENLAPRPIAIRYQGDRNFDLLLMGSATKPIFAAGALATHPTLADRFAVRGPAPEESAIFGIPVRPSWDVGRSVGLDGRGWCDFQSYLARSDNRYAVELGFLGLTEAQPGRDGPIAVEPGRRAGEIRESMDGGRSPWPSVPRFEPTVGFSAARPAVFENLDETQLARNLQRMFGVDVAAGGAGNRVQRRFLTSGWTGDESDSPARWLETAQDSGSEDPSRPGGPSASRGRRDLRMFAAISPVAANLAFDEVDSPRKYVSLLLGGSSNRWSTVEFGSAFATCVLGKPVLPAFLQRASPVRAARFREDFQETARRLRPGLEAVVIRPAGTAHNGLDRAGALAVIKRLGSVSVYAKTGTLADPAGGGTETSRIVLALVRWQDRGKTVPARGLVFSFVAERAKEGLASQWLGEFLRENEPEIRARLAEP